jgi:multicomponent Na+:H+ antiporter subunit B
MSRRARGIVFGVGAVGLAALLIWGFAGLPSFGDFHGRYGELLARVAVPERKASEVVASTTFDFRGFDTLGEEFILFTAAIGLLVLLRIQRGEEEVPAEPEGGPQPTGRSLTLRSIATALVGPVLVLGIYVVAHGHLTPGGGFQGGVILMTAFLLIHVAGTHLHLGRTRPLAAMEVAEASGAAGFVLIGIGGIVLAAAFLDNFLPFGTFGSLLSGGDIPLLNIAVGIEVMGALLVVLGELLDQRMLTRRGHR